MFRGFTVFAFNLFGVMTGWFAMDYARGYGIESLARAIVALFVAALLIWLQAMTAPREWYSGRNHV